MDSERANRWITIASNFAVLVGLIFVGIEVRNSSKSVTAQSANAISGHNEFNYVVASNTELSRIVYLGLRDPDELTDAEAYRAALMITSLFNQYYEVHKLYKSGAISDTQWTMTATDINRIMQLPGTKIFLETNPVFEPDFFDDVRRLAGENFEKARNLGRDTIAPE